MDLLHRLDHTTEIPESGADVLAHFWPMGSPGGGLMPSPSRGRCMRRAARSAAVRISDSR